MFVTRGSKRNATSRTYLPWLRIGVVNVFRVLAALDVWSSAAVLAARIPASTIDSPLFERAVTIGVEQRCVRLGQERKSLRVCRFGGLGVLGVVHSGAGLLLDCTARGVMPWARYDRFEYNVLPVIGPGQHRTEFSVGRGVVGSVQPDPPMFFNRGSSRNPSSSVTANPTTEVPCVST